MIGDEEKWHFSLATEPKVRRSSRLWCAKQKAMQSHSLFAWQTDGSVSVRHGAPKMKKKVHFQTDGSDSVRHGASF